MSNGFYLSQAVLWILVILNSLIIVGLVRIVAQLQQAGVATNPSAGSSWVGREAPEFSGVDLSGSPVRSMDFLGRVVALLFVSPTCTNCMTTLTELEALSRKVRGNVVVICGAPHDECSALANTYELHMQVVSDEKDELVRLFGITSLPTALLLVNNKIQSYGMPGPVEDFEAALQDAQQQGDLQRVA